MKHVLWLLLVLLNTAFAKPTVDQYWQDTGIDYQQTVYGTLNNRNCKSSPRQFLGCYNMLNQVLWLMNPKEMGFLMLDMSGTSAQYQPVWHQDFKKFSQEKRAYYNYLAEAVSNFGVVELDKFDFNPQVLLADLEASVINDKNRARIAGTLVNAFLALAFDPHTKIVPKAQWKENNQKQQDLRAFGLIYNQIEKDKFLITTVHPNSNAAAQKLTAGEFILSVNGKTKFEDWRKELQEKDSVKFQTNKRLVMLTKSHFSIDMITTERTGDVGVLKILSFAFMGACEQVHDLLKTKLKGVKKLIIDLRGNGGGFVHEGKCIQETFMEPGSISFATMALGQNEIKYEVKRSQRAIWADVPLVIMVAGNSASMAEIMPHFLQAYGKAVIVGQQSFGKGSMQGVANMIGNDLIHYIGTQAVVYGPDAVTMHTHGVFPDFEVGRFYGKPLQEFQREVDIFELVWKMPRDKVTWDLRQQMVDRIKSCYRPEAVKRAYQSKSEVGKLLFDNQLETAKVVSGCFDHNLSSVALPVANRYRMVMK